MGLDVGLICARLHRLVFNTATSAGVYFVFISGFNEGHVVLRFGQRDLRGDQVRDAARPDVDFLPCTRPATRNIGFEAIEALVGGGARRGVPRLGSGLDFCFRSSRSE